jgi:O-antigen ligase/tetratricopeptide (TPR) repeat protein
MAALSSIFWILGFTLSVVIAPQLRMWTWGPTMLCFGAATLFALPVLLRKDLGREAMYVLIPGIATAAWIALRAFLSPVAELATQDLLLLAMAVSTFIVFRAAGNGALSGKFLAGGIALILGASLWVIGKQLANPSYSPVFPAGEANFIRGFFGHYSYCAAFLVPSALLLAGLGLHGRFHWAVRVILLALAVAGLAAVVLTKSRGGVIGMGVGVGALALGSVLIGKRKGARWFVPVAIIAPLALIGAIILFLNVLGGVQEQREGGDLSGMLDNTIRFYMLGMAISCIAMHPWLGGGSRSFSWESFQAWDVAAYGRGAAKPEHVHNELVQTVSEYGIVGGFLLIVFLGCVIFAALASSTSKDRSGSAMAMDGWQIGGLAGLAGLFAQSQFEGILRIPPGAILLGLCLAAASAAVTEKSSATRRFSPASVLLALCALTTMIPLLAYGWKGTKATHALWPAHFSQIPMGTEARIEALTVGIEAWPLNPLLQHRGVLYRKLAAEEDLDSAGRRERMELALANFRRASELHPLDPTNPLNQAGTLALLGRNEEAEPLFRQAIRAQGNMEATFNANHRFAEFLLARGVAEHAGKDFTAAITTFQIAARHMDKALELTKDWSMEMTGFDLKVKIRSALGQSLEAASDYRGALEQYDHVTTLREGSSGHYLAGLLLGKRAVAAWAERRSEDALRLFLDAEQRVIQPNPLPAGITEAKRAEYREYLRRTILYLEGAKVEPSDRVDF